MRLISSLVLLLLASTADAQQDISRFEIFDRYDPTHTAHEVGGIAGEHIDLRTLGLSWEVEDYVIPGNGGLDMVISRSFNRLSHTPSDMGHWYFGVPRLQIPTSPWRGPYDPASATMDTFTAAWNNLYARMGFGTTNLCANAGNLIDEYVVGSLNGQTKAGILFAAPLMLHIPGEGSKLLLEKAASADHFPFTAQYVTTDNWIARCLAASADRLWGGFEVVSPKGVTYTFDFIQYMVPGEYALGSAGGWIEMGISSIEDVHGNRIDYQYDLGAGGTDLLTRIEASDGRLVTLEYYPGSILGVDVKGSPLSLISKVNVHADGEVHTIQYDYCDFADFYILEIGCRPINLGPGEDLPVLHQVTFPGGERTQYRYNPDMYSVNIQLAWGNFEFLLESVRLPSGGTVSYEYANGYHPVLQNTNSPAPRLSRRRTSGRDVPPAEWRYDYEFSNHIESSTVTGPGARQDVYEFYEGLGTYEFRIAKYPGQHGWPDTAPTDYDEIMGQLKSHSVRRSSDGTLFRETRYDYALLPFIGRQYYSGNWLGWPTLVLAQIRPIPLSRTEVIDWHTSTEPLQYARYTNAAEFDEYAFPLTVHEQGIDVLAPEHLREERRDYEWRHDTFYWIIGLPSVQSSDGYEVRRTYRSRGLVKSLSDGGVLTNYEYDSTGNLRAETWTNEGLSYRATYDDYHRGKPQFESYPVTPSTGVMQTIARSVNDLGQIVWAEDGLGHRTVYERDFLGRPVSVTEPATAAIAIEYQKNDSGDVAEIVTTQGNRQRVVSIDGFGRGILLRDYADITDSDAARALTWLYDENGRTAFKSYPFAWSSSANPDGTHFAYDELGRPVSETNSVTGRSIEFCYSWRCNSGDYFQAVGHLYNGFVRTDEEGYQAGFEYAAVGQPRFDQLARVIEQITGPAGAGAASFRHTSMRIDANGNIQSVEQGEVGGDAWIREFVYAHPRLLEEHHPETGVTLHEYDDRGNRVSTTVGAGPAIRFSYDGLGRMTSVDYAGDKDDIYYQYDAAGRLQTIENAATRWAYQYDEADRLVSEAIVLPDTTAEFTYSYDALGNLQTLTYPSGTAVDYDPDGFGRPRRAGEVVQSAEYWPNNAIRAIQYGNGVSASFRQNRRQMPRERLFVGMDQSLLSGQLYSYDNVGNMLRITDQRDTGQDAAMKYDGLSRLVSVTNMFGRGDVGYDATDNILTSTIDGRDLEYSYDSMNRLESVLASQTYRVEVEHDAAGNVTGSDTFRFIYNAAAQLTGVSQLPDLSYTYDGNGRRTISEDTDGVAYSVYNKEGKLAYVNSCDKGGEISEFVYLGVELVGRMDSACTQGCHP